MVPTVFVCSAGGTSCQQRNTIDKKYRSAEGEKADRVNPISESPLSYPDTQEGIMEDIGDVLLFLLELVLWLVDAFTKPEKPAAH
jgi:hypothetical protein